MSVEYLSVEQEARYGRFAAEPSPGELEQFFRLDSEALGRARPRRRPATRLGWAVQWGTASAAPEAGRPHHDQPGAPMSCLRTSPTSLPSEVVTGELSTLRSVIVRRISWTLTNGRYVLGPGRMTCSTGRSGSASSSSARSSPSTTRCWPTPSP